MVPFLFCKSFGIIRMKLCIRFRKFLHQHADCLCLIFWNTGPFCEISVSKCPPTIKCALLQYTTPLPVQCNLSPDLLKFLSGTVTEITFIPQHCECGNCKAGRKRCPAQRLMVRTRRYMCTHRRERIPVTVICLYVRPATGICVIASPDLRKIAQNAGIKTVSACCTPFK